MNVKKKNRKKWYDKTQKYSDVGKRAVGSGEDREINEKFSIPKIKVSKILKSLKVAKVVKAVVPKSSKSPKTNAASVKSKGAINPFKGKGTTQDFIHKAIHFTAHHAEKKIAAAFGALKKIGSTHSTALGPAHAGYAAAVTAGSPKSTSTLSSTPSPTPFWAPKTSAASPQPQAKSTSIQKPAKVIAPVKTPKSFFHGSTPPKPQSFFHKPTLIAPTPASKTWSKPTVKSPWTKPTTTPGVHPDKILKPDTDLGKMFGIDIDKSHEPTPANKPPEFKPSYKIKPSVVTGAVSTKGVTYKFKSSPKVTSKLASDIPPLPKIEPAQAPPIPPETAKPKSSWAKPSIKSAFPATKAQRQILQFHGVHDDDIDKMSSDDASGRIKFNKIGTSLNPVKTEMVAQASLGALPIGSLPTEDPEKRKKYNLLVKPFMPNAVSSKESGNMSRLGESNMADLKESMKTLTFSSADVHSLQKAYYELSKSGNTDSRLWVFSGTREEGGGYAFDVTAREDDGWFDPAKLTYLLPSDVSMSALKAGRSAHITHDWQDDPSLDVSSHLGVLPGILEILAGKKHPRDVVNEIVNRKLIEDKTCHDVLTANGYDRMGGVPEGSAVYSHPNSGHSVMVTGESSWHFGHKNGEPSKQGTGPRELESHLASVATKAA